MTDPVTAASAAEAADALATFLAAWEAAGLSETIAATAAAARDGERPGTYRRKLTATTLRAVLDRLRQLEDERASADANYSITWDHDFAYLWCARCPNTERPVNVQAGNPTGLGEFANAMRAHDAEHAARDRPDAEAPFADPAALDRAARDGLTWDGEQEATF